MQACKHQQDLYDQIRENINFIYRAEGQSIYNEYSRQRRRPLPNSASFASRVCLRATRSNRPGLPRSAVVRQVQRKLGSAGPYR